MILSTSDALTFVVRNTDMTEFGFLPPREGTEFHRT